MTSYNEMAAEAVRPARLLLQAADNRGSVNRAYYAIFNAARGALNAIEPGLGDAKKHKTVISRFSARFVKSGAVEARLGRALTRAFDARLAADYENEEIDTEVATTIVVSAEDFVSELARFLKSRTP